GLGGSALYLGSPPALFDNTANVNFGGARRIVNVATANNAPVVLEMDGRLTNGQLDKATGAGGLLGTNATKSLGLTETQSLVFSANGSFSPSFRGVPATVAIPVTQELQLVQIAGTTGGSLTLSYNGVSANLPVSRVDATQTITMSGAGGTFRL